MRWLVPLGSPSQTSSLGTKFAPSANFGGGGSRTPVRRGLRLEAYMLIPFASCFRPRPSGTSNNGPPTSLSPLSRLSLKIPRRLIPSQPTDRRLSPPCGPDEGDGYLIRQRRHTACWQLSMSHSDYGWCGPPACLLSASAPVETGTPPRSISDYAPLSPVSRGPPGRGISIHSGEA